MLTEIKAQYYQLLEFLMQHYRCSDLSGRANSQNEDVRMHQISLYVHHNYAKAVDLKELAGRCIFRGISVTVCETEIWNEIFGLCEENPSVTCEGRFTAYRKQHYANYIMKAVSPAQDFLPGI
ncbi:MAG: hypothetical protein V8R46_03170 [Eubacterium ramulus]